MSAPQQNYSEADLLSAGAQLCFIYTLHASGDLTCRPRYVGFTVRPNYRGAEHHRKQQHGRKGEWIRELLKIGQKAVLTIVHRFRSDSLAERILVEATWIESYREKYPDILNDFGAGNGVGKTSDTLRHKRSEHMKRWCSNPAVKQQRSELMKRRYADPVERARLNEINRKRFTNEAERKKRSESQKKRWAKVGEREKQKERMKRCLENPAIRENYNAAMARRKLEKELDEY